MLSCLYKMNSVKEVIQTFRRRLLASDIAPDIVKIIYFGSRAKGRPRKESDLDILIISSNGEKVHQRVAEIAFELQMNYGAPLEPLVESLDNLIPVNSYFLYNILRYGKEVYTMKKKDLKRKASQNLSFLAEEYLDAAENSLNNGHPRLAVDAAYNSAELSVKALLLKKIDDLPGSHGGIVSKFGALYVKTKEMERSLGRDLNQALELRNSARYKYQATITKDQAKAIIALAQRLIELTKTHL